jgi:hypothetical protein
MELSQEEEYSLSHRRLFPTGVPFQVILCFSVTKSKNTRSEFYRSVAARTWKHWSCSFSDSGCVALSPGLKRPPQLQSGRVTKGAAPKSGSLERSKTNSRNNFGVVEL